MAPSKGSNAPKGKSKQGDTSGEASKSRISQSDVPAYSLEQALRIAKAIGDNYAFKPTKPLSVAAALDMSPSSGGFRGMTGAAIAYGLTSGGYNAPEIKLEALALKILRPLEEGDELKGRRDAILRPRVFREFLQKYDGASLPREDIARNVLADMGVPSDRAGEVLQLILESATAVGFIREIKGKQYVDLQGTTPPLNSDDDSAANGEPEEEEEPGGRQPMLQAIQRTDPPRVTTGSAPSSGELHETNRRRVYITHGKNKSFVEPIKKLLSFGELQAVVSVDKQSVSVPLPDKVMGEMRSCGAAIIHVDAEQKLIDSEAHEHVVLNPNVLIEIGAAMALFGRRFILLVRDGVSLPSNLQGLYEVRYRGDSLDGDATIKLLEAINDIKNHPLPLRYASEGPGSA